MEKRTPGRLEGVDGPAFLCAAEGGEPQHYFVRTIRFIAACVPAVSR